MMRRPVALCTLLLCLLPRWAAADCQPVDDPDSTNHVVFAMAPSDRLQIDDIMCFTTANGEKTFDYAAFDWQWRRNGRPVAQGRLKPPYDYQGIVGTDIRQLDRQTVIINSYAERGGILHLLYWPNPHTLHAYHLAHVGGDEEGVCSRASAGTVHLQRCYFNGKHTAYYGPVLQLQPTAHGWRVRNRKVVRTFTDFRHAPAFPAAAPP